MSQPSQRLASIDVLRALTMFLMIFVNDLWTLRDIPAWLEHTAAQEDGMGLADTVFPAFLFIVGLSIPFAIGRRLAKGVAQTSILGHILTRSLALLIMGFFHVNLEHYNEAAALLPVPVWVILLITSFFLIWLDYSPNLAKSKRWLLQGTGIALLIFLAVVYKGGDADHPVWLKPYWWGILGLIGWSYLLCALIFLFSKGRLLALIVSLLFFLLFNIAEHAGWLSFLQPVKNYIWIVGGGSMPALTMAGTVSAVIYSSLSKKEKHVQYGFILAGFALIMLVAGFAIRPFWGISKIRATPSWVMICIGISLVCFLILIFVADIKNKQHWFAVIKPAGTSTLTAYLLPYIHYAVCGLAAISLPLLLRTGVLGIIKSMVFALLIILITGLLGKCRLRLKI